MIDRKQFFKQLFAGVSASMLASSMPARAASWVDNLGDLGETQVAELDDEWASVRRHFLHEADYHYLNSATLGLIPDLVIEAMEMQLRARLALGKYWLDPTAVNPVAKMIGADPMEVGITHNTSHGINIIAQGLHLRRNDEVIITSHEHVGNALPWLNRKRRDGIKLKVFEPGITAAENLNRISDLIGRRTKVIAIPHITCTIGTVFPIREIAQLAKEKNIFLFVDGAHAPGMVPLDMKSMGCDFYASCGHKWLCGPAGSGFLYINKDRINEIDPIMVGAYSDKGWELTKQNQTLDDFVPEVERFEYGTRDPVKHAGLAAAISFMETIGWEKIANRQLDLHHSLKEKLLAFPEIEILTPSEKGSYAAILGFRFPEKYSPDFRDMCREQKIRIREVREAGLNSFRASTHIFTNDENIDALINVVKTMFK